MLKSIFHSYISNSPSSSTFIDESYQETNVEKKHNCEYNEDDWGFFIELDLENHVHDKIIRKYHNKNKPILSQIDEESQEEETKPIYYPYPKIEYEMIYYICGIVVFVILLN